MKRIFTLLLAVASLTAVSCQKEQDKVIDNSEKGLVKVSFRAQSPEMNGETKTSLASNGSLYWSYGDHICVWDGTGLRGFASDIKEGDEPTKTTMFEGSIQSGATNFIAIYPYLEPYTSGVTYSEGKMVTTLPAKQYAVVNSFANEANVAIATGTIGNEVLAEGTDALAEFIFSNVGSLIKFTISQDGVHKSVTIKTQTDDKIAGEISITPATAVAATTENSVDAVTIEAKTGYLAAGNYYAVILPLEDKKLSFSFSDGYSTKTRKAKSSISVGRSSYYDMGTIDTGISYPDPYIGEWVIAGTHQDTKLVLKKYDSGNFYPADVATSIVDGIVTVSGAKTDYKVTIAKESEGTYEGMYTIKDAGNKYLTAYATNNYLKGVAAEYLEVGSYWSITGAPGELKIVASKYNVNNAKNELRVNNNNGSNRRISCYASNSSQPAVELYKYADVVETIAPTANPSISCTDNTISISCTTESATIYYATSTTSLASLEDVTPTNVYSEPIAITQTTYVKAYATKSGNSDSEMVTATCNYVAGGNPKTTLTNANIVAAGNAASGYGSISSMTDENGYVYSAYAIKNYHSNNTSSYHFLQIKKYDNTNAYYIHVPEIGKKITQIKMTVSSTSQPMTGGGNGATLFFSSSNTTSATGEGIASATGDASVSIDCSSLNLNTGYITAGGAVRIWDVEVTYVPDNSPKITAADITVNTALGVTNQYATYSIANFAGDDDVTVKSYTGCVSAAVIETVQEDNKDVKKIKYRVSPNYGTTEAAGTIVLQSDEVEEDVTINVTQAYDNSFTHSGTTGSAPNYVLTIPNNATTASITVTSSVFGYNTSVAAADQKNLTISSGASGNASASAQTITIASTEDAPAAGNDALTLGTISIFRNNNSSDPQKITITVKKAVAAAAGGEEVTIIAPPTNCTVTASVSGTPIASGDSVAEGATVTLAGSTTTPAVHAFDSWVVYKTGDTNTTITVTNNTFVMPAYAVTIMGVFTTTVTKTMNDIVSANSYTVSSGNTIGTIATSFSLDSNVTVSTSGSANCGTFWGTTTYDWRLYQAQSGDITINAGNNTITSLTITYSTSNSGTLKSGTTTISSNSIQTPNASSITYTVGNTGNKTNGQVRVTQISVTYK